MASASLAWVRNKKTKNTREQIKNLKKEKLPLKIPILWSLLLWLHQDILTVATAGHSVEPKKIFRDKKASHCSNQQMYAADASTEQGFGPFSNTNNKNCRKTVDNTWKV